MTSIRRWSCLLLAFVLCLGSTAFAAYAPGMYEGTGKGFGGDVKVTVEVDEGNILNVSVEGKDETAGIGSRALEVMPGLILAAQGSPADVVSGCTFTSKGILDALNDALKQASGETSAQTAAVSMAPGVYEGQAMGYSRTRPVCVNVTVTKDAITDIQVASNKENVGILESVTTLLIPRMLETQSVAVDAICGATASSNAVKATVEDCLTQALVAGGSDASAMDHFRTTTQPAVSEETLEADVLVVGIGASGAAAAMMAADTQNQEGMDVSVLAIDKAGKFGGTGCNTSVMLGFDSKITEAMFNNGEPYFDKAVVDEELHAAVSLNDFQEMGWRKIQNESGEMLDWLISHGFYFGQAKPGLAGSYPVTYEYNGVAGEASLAVTYGFYKDMMEDFTALGGKYLLETEATDLIYDEQSGAVTGVKAVNHHTGVHYTINAKSVILATGGFGANDEMEKALYEGHQTGAYRHDISMMQNDGKMIASAIDIGAATAGFEDCLNGVIWNIGIPNRLSGHEIIWKEGSYDMFRDDVGAWSVSDIPEMMVNDWDGVFVNAQGRRFVNEAGVWAGKNNNGSLYYTLWSKDLLDYVNEHGFSVNFSGNFLTTSSMTSGVFPMETGVKDMGADLYALMDECVATGNAVKADTLEELAALVGMEPAALKETVAAYNAACASGNDEAFGKPAPFLHAIGEDGPYYFLLAMPRAYTSGGGLHVNNDLQVLSASDDATPIPGLFAVGTDCLGATPPFFYGGEYLSWAFVSGHGAGRTAARYAAGRPLTDPEGYEPVDYLAYVQEHGMVINEQDDEASAATDLLRPAA